MKSRFEDFKAKALSLRAEGKSYGEICKILKITIPKSTLSCWCKNFPLSKNQQARLKALTAQGIKRGRATALVVNKTKRENYIKEVNRRVCHLSKKLEDKNVAKIALAMLYLGEGSKKGGAMMFGNSNPTVIQLFLKLLRFCYNIDEHKFRCTVQCRADQDIRNLEIFWSKITSIPLDLFYKPQVDKRTTGLITKKVDYKGVCRIDYFSGDIFVELMQIVEVLGGK